MDTDAAELGARLVIIPYARHMYGPGAIPQGQEEVDALGRKVSEWRDYNRTWLGRNLGGEAAEEYQSTSTHWNFGAADDPRTNLRWLAENVESEISKLIHSPAPTYVATTRHSGTCDAATGSQVDGGEATMAATNRKLVMVIYGHDTEANSGLFDWLRGRAPATRMEPDHRGYRQRQSLHRSSP